MFRPQLFPRNPWPLEEICRVAKGFGLVVTLLVYDDVHPVCHTLVLRTHYSTSGTKITAFLKLSDVGRHREILVSRPAYAKEVKAPRRLGVNSPTWHHERARLTGIPDDEVDEEFHKRNGYDRFFEDYAKA